MLHVRAGEELSQVCPKLKSHFDTVASPMMMGNSSLVSIMMGNNNLVSIMNSLVSVIIVLCQ